MRVFDPDFVTEKDRDFYEPIWSSVLHLGGTRGDFYIASRELERDGHVHEAIVPRGGFGRIASALTREERLLDVGEVDITFSNFPVLSTSERMSDVLPTTLTARLAEIWLSFRTAADTLASDIMFAGVLSSTVDTPTGFNLRRGTVHLKSLSEYYLNRPWGRVVTEGRFPFSRESDRGKTIPIVIGSVERAPGRAVRASYQSTPTAAVTNSGTAQLLQVDLGTNAVSETWTITATPPETHEQTTIDGSAELGKLATDVVFDAASNGSTGAAAATSITFAHTVGAGARRLLLVTVHPGSTSATAVSSVTYGGTPLTQLGRISNVGPTQMWVLYDPPSGAANVVVTLASSIFAVAGAVSFSEAGSVSAAGGTFIQQIHGVTPGTSTTLSDPNRGVIKGGMLVDAFTRHGSGGTITAGAGQTERVNAVTSSGTAAQNVRGGVSTRAAAASTGLESVSWSTSPAAYVDLVSVIVLPNRTASSQSYQTTGTQPLTAIDLWLAKNPAWTSPATPKVFVRIFADSGGASTGDPLASVSAEVPSTTFAWFRLTLPSSHTSAAGTTYHVVVTASSDSDSTLFAGGGNGGVLWGKNSAGGYASGNANAGRYDYASILTGWSPGFGPRNPTWLGGMTTEDFGFKLIFGGGGLSYSFAGSVTGADGTGTFADDSTSTSGKLAIKSSYWTGSPAAGDVWTVVVDLSPSEVIFSESPSATPVSRIGDVYWSDQVITSGTSVSAPADTGTSWTFGNGTRNAIAQSWPISGGAETFRQIGFAIGKNNQPSSTVRFELREDNAGSPAAEALVSVDVSPDEIQDVGIDEAMVLKDIPPTTVRGSTVWLVAITDGADSTNYYSVALNNTNPLAGSGKTQATADGSWTANTAGHDFVAQITGLTVTKQLSTDDGTGTNVARVLIDLEIPDDVELSADVDGITDDTDGTYTGAAGTLLTVPTHVAHWLLRQAGVPVGNIDLAGTFSASTPRYGSTYRLNGVIQDEGTWKQVLLQLAFESRSAFDWPVDKAQWKFLPDSSSAAIAETIELADLVLDGDGPDAVPAVAVDFSDSDKRVNTIDLRYSRTARESRGLTAYRRVYSESDADALVTDPPADNPELFMCDFVTSSGMAAALAEFYLDRLSTSKRRVTVTGRLALLHFEKDDVIGFDMANVAGGANLPGVFPIPLGDTFAGLSGGEAFTIERIEIDPALNRVTLTAREL